MKKLAISIFILFIFVAALYAIVQGSIGRTYIQKLLTKALKESGYEVKIGQIQGTLPHQINLKTVAISGKETNVTIEELKLRPILWRLLKKEIAFKNIEAKGLSISNSAPLDFQGEFRITAKKAYLNGVSQGWNLRAQFDRKLKHARFNAKNDLIYVRGAAQLNDSYELTESILQINSDTLLSKLPLEASGKFLANVTITHPSDHYRGAVTWQVPNLTIDQNLVGVVKGEGEILYHNRTIEGEFKILPLAKATFHLTLRPDQLLTGTTHLNIENLQSLHIPHLYGGLDLKADLRIVNETQELHLDAVATNFYYKTIFAQKASLYSDLENPFQEVRGLFSLELEQAKWKDLELNTLNLETIRSETEWPFKLFAEGEWKHPLEVQMEGSLKNRSLLAIETFNGTFFNHPFTLNQPIQLEQTPEIFRLKNVEVSIAEASVYLDIERKGEQSQTQIQFNQLPIDFLSLNPLDTSIEGTLDLKANIQEKNNQLQGDLKASIAHLKPFDAIGNFEGEFNQDLLTLKGNLGLQDVSLLQLDLSLPIHLSAWPFDASLLFHKEVKGEISLNGPVEELIDFLNLGPHRLEGTCQGKLKISNTLYRPFVEGAILFKNGFYENYYTGTELRNIQASFWAEKNKIYLRSFTAQDASEVGSLSARGEITLLQSDLYPFTIDAHLTRFQMTQIDLVSSMANGQIHIEGNTTSALAKGNVTLEQTNLSIPDHIPRPLPNLEVTYRNQIHPIALPQTNYRPYPLYLDLDISTSEPLSISGRGLNSEWSGLFHLGGTQTALAAKGKLELIDGEFNFSSRSFRLTEGTLSLSGIEHEMPYLNLAGTTETKGVSIIARLNGPLNNPQITLHSVPPLPLGSIMSYLLFGQDINEISGFQALQLATSLASLAGTGPDVMESTRKSLGIDRLRIISNPNDEGEQTVALEVGKYVSDGVLVTFTQGTEDSAPNIRVEIELKNNFIFQIESDQHQEQGKFTLKWNRNY